MKQKQILFENAIIKLKTLYTNCEMSSLRQGRWFREQNICYGSVRTGVLIPKPKSGQAWWLA